MLPTKIRSIAQPRWTDELHWVRQPGNRFMADVDHDWRIWTDLDGGRTVVRNKGWTSTDEFDTLVEALKSLDYRPDA